jgi:hypothetical protein
MDLALVIDKLVPGADFRKSENLTMLSQTWLDSRPIPTQEELDNAWSEIQETLNTRKIWPTVADFWKVFTNTQKYQIMTSENPTLIVARADLLAHRGEVWSDNSDLTIALDAMVTDSIITAEKKTEILSN